MPDPGRQRRRGEAFRPHPNESRSQAAHSITPNYPRRAPFKQLRNNLVDKPTPRWSPQTASKASDPAPPPKGGFNELAPLIEWAMTKPA